MLEKPYKIAKVCSSSGEGSYTVCLYETFETCNCKGFQVRKKCRHVKWVREMNAKDEKGDGKVEELPF